MPFDSSLRILLRCPHWQPIHHFPSTSSVAGSENTRPLHIVPARFQRDQQIRKDVADLSRLLQFSRLKIPYPEVADGMTLKIIDAAKMLYIEPILAVANATRAEGHPPLLAVEDATNYGAGTIWFNFAAGELPFPEVSLHAPLLNLPAIGFMQPGSLDIKSWISEPNADGSPSMDIILAAANQYPHCTLLLSDSVSALLIRRVPDGPNGLTNFLYESFDDLRDPPLRLIISSILYSELHKSGFHYFYRPWKSGWRLPSGTLNNPAIPFPTLETALQTCTSNADFDWYTAIHSSDYRGLITQWMKRTYSTLSSRPPASVRDVLSVRSFAYARDRVPLAPAYAERHLPDETQSFLEQTKRQTFLPEVMRLLQSSDVVEVEIMEEMRSSAHSDDVTFLCRIKSAGEYPVDFDHELCLKIFDDRRIRTKATDSDNVHQWYIASTWESSEELIATTDAAYQGLRHAQGSVIPFYYGAHAVTLSDGAVCWAVLTEVISGVTPRDVPQGIPDEFKGEVVDSVRQFVRVLQCADITRGGWRYSDVRVQVPPNDSGRDPSGQAVCAVVNLSRSKFADVLGSEMPEDPHGELEALLSLSFGPELVAKHFEPKEPWDFYSDSRNTFIGRGWRPIDQDIILEGDDARRAGCGEEDLREYRPGGHYLVEIGEQLNFRYTILRKLGWGAYATVWLADDSSTNRHVVLKILVAQQIPGLEETAVLGALAAASPDCPHVVRHTDVFEHPGPNGLHTVIVFEPLGPSLIDYCSRRPEGRLAERAVKKVARQLLVALEYTHGNGIIHTDIKQGNILFDIPEIESHLQRQRMAGYGRPLGQCSSPPAPDFSIKLIDFGNAQRIGAKPDLYPIQPTSLRSPKVILNADWGAAVDIWNLACLIYELLSGSVLFSTPEDEDDAVYHQLAKMQSLCGPFPEHLLKAGQKTSLYFNKDTGRVKNVFVPPFTLKSMVSSRNIGMNEEELEHFCDFLVSMLQLDPASRPSASELLRHPWLVESE